MMVRNENETAFEIHHLDWDTSFFGSPMGSVMIPPAQSGLSSTVQSVPADHPAKPRHSFLPGSGFGCQLWRTA
jgi:hypothetical protein